MQNSHEYDKILTRLSIVLSRLYDGEQLGVLELAEEFNVSSRTIQRDFNERLFRFPIVKVGRKWALDEQFLKNGFKNIKSLTPQEEITLDIFENFSENVSPKFQEIAKKLLSKIKNEHENPVYLRVAIEDIGDKLQEIKILDEAIRESKLVEFVHKSRYRLVEPCRIVNFEGYWYFYAKELIDGRVKTFYIKEISKLKKKNDLFVKDSALLQRLGGALNVWFDPNIEPFGVRLLVKNEIAKYFERRPISKFQKVLETRENGDMILETLITNFKEILPTIKYWMPNILVLEPLELKNEMEKIALEYFKEQTKL
jgi:predicted DNA-binding transcriptional regulator YafY